MKKLFLLLCFIPMLYAQDTPDSNDSTHSSVIIDITEHSPSAEGLLMSQVAGFTFLRSANVKFADAINTRFNNKIQEAIKSPRKEKKSALTLLDKLIVNKEDEDVVAWQELHKMIVEATQEVYLEQNKEIADIKLKMEKRWTKKKSAVVTGGCTIITGLITAAITYFRDKGYF